MHLRRVVALTTCLLGVLLAVGACGTTSHPGALEEEYGNPGKPVVDAGKDATSDAAIGDASTDAAVDLDAGLGGDGGPNAYGATACVHCGQTACASEWKACLGDAECKAFYSCYYDCPCGGPNGTCPKLPICADCPFANSSAWFDYGACMSANFKACGCT